MAIDSLTDIVLLLADPGSWVGMSTITKNLIKIIILGLVEFHPLSGRVERGGQSLVRASFPVSRKILSSNSPNAPRQIHCSTGK